MKGTAIVIVTYNSAGEIGACLDAVLGSGAEVVVVDNASTDGTQEEVRRRGAALIANPGNRGFAAAVNQGFRATTAPYVLLLNPDAVLLTSLEPLLAACRLPGAAASGGLTLGQNGEPQTGWTVRRLPTPLALCLEVLLVNRLWPSNPVNWRFRCYDLSLAGTEPMEVEQPAGAFLMVNRAAWNQLGGLDERFHPLWFEDVDFCRRAIDAGWRIFYAPLAVVKHTGGHSIRKMPLGFREICWYGSLLEYASKHYSPFHRRLVCGSVVAGSVVRGVFHMFRRGGWQRLAGYRSIASMAARRFVSRESGRENLS